MFVHTCVTIYDLPGEGKSDFVAVVPASEYIFCLHMLRLLVHPWLSDGVNLTCQFSPCQAQQNVSHLSPKTVLTVKYRSQFSSRDFITPDF